jgi:hypothetical protein
MNEVVQMALSIMKKSYYFAVQYLYSGVGFIAREVKVRLKGMEKCKARKDLDKTCAALGRELHTLFKQGKMFWQDEPGMTDKLKVVEEAEARFLAVEQGIEDINHEYLKKKEQIREKYSEKRAAVNEPTEL